MIRIELVLLIINEICSWMVVGFVDDVSFFASGNIALENMQQILTIYSSLYQAIGGKVLGDKTMFFY